MSAALHRCDATHIVLIPGVQLCVQTQNGYHAEIAVAATEYRDGEERQDAMKKLVQMVESLPSF
jgi:hypothetical protein